MLTGNLAGRVLVASEPTHKSSDGKSWRSLASRADRSGKCCGACHMLYVGEESPRVGGANHGQIALGEGRRCGRFFLGTIPVACQPSPAYLQRGSRAADHSKG